MLSEEKETVLIETESGSVKLIFDIRILTIDNLSGGMREALKEMVNVKLLFDPIFFLIGISNAIGMIGFYTPFVYLPSMAAQYVILHNALKKNHHQFSLIQDGISTEDAAFLVSVIGISNTVGRVLSGWISDFSWVWNKQKIYQQQRHIYTYFVIKVNSLVVTNSAIILSALTVFLFPYCSSYWSLVIMALLFGFFVGKRMSSSKWAGEDLLLTLTLTFQLPTSASHRSSWWTSWA